MTFWRRDIASARIENADDLSSSPRMRRHAACSFLLSIAFFVTAFVMTSVSVQATEPPVGGEYNLEIGGQGRPAPPYPSIPNYTPNLQYQGAGPEYTVQVSRHHIIPYNTLRDFYNAVRVNGRLSNLRQFFSLFGLNIRYYASSSSVTCSASVASDIEAASDVATYIGEGRIRSGGSGRPNGFDTFAQFYAWIPGNLFIGPQNRVDDPGNQIDEGARFIIGDDRYNILQDLYNNMTDYINNRTSNLNPIMAGLTRLSRQLGVAPLQANQWVLVGYDAYGFPQYRIRRTGSTLDQRFSDVRTVKKVDVKESSPDDCSHLPPPSGYDPSFIVRQLIISP